MTGKKSAATPAAKSRRAVKSAKPASSQIAEAAKQQPEAPLNTAIWGPVLPNANAAAVMTAYAKDFGTEGSDCTELMGALSKQIAAVRSGDDTKIMQGMLAAQAFTLQSIFTRLALRAERLDQLSQWEATLRMALKAQGQCRTTLETLAAIQNPPVVFARQANIVHGPQQINHGTGSPHASPAHAQAPAANSAFEQSKLLEQDDGQRMDFGATGAAAAGHPAMAPVGTIYGPEDVAGQGTSRKERRQGAAAGKAARSRQSAS